MSYNACVSPGSVNYTFKNQALFGSYEILKKNLEIGINTIDF